MPHKNKRKIIRIGDTSLAVIIPKAWIRYNNLAYGDNLEIISNGKLIIQKPRRD